MHEKKAPENRKHEVKIAPPSVPTHEALYEERERDLKSQSRTKTFFKTWNVKSRSALSWALSWGFVQKRL